MLPGSVRFRAGGSIVRLQLVLLEGSHKGHRINVEIGLVILGRAKGSAIRIPSERISRRHCRLWLEKSKVWVEDLGSENGTFVNDDAVVGRVQLNPGDELKVAHLRFRVQFQPERAEREERTEPLPAVEGADDDLALIPIDDEPLKKPVPDDDTDDFDLPYVDDDAQPAEAAESMNLPTQNPFDFKNILRELDDKSDKDD
jgi:predicted component of type VI protein secretion system